MKGMLTERDVMVQHAKEELHIFNEDSKKYTTELQ